MFSRRCFAERRWWQWVSVTGSRLVHSPVLCLFPSSNRFSVLGHGAEQVEEQRHLDIWDGKGDEVPALGGDGGCGRSSQLT